MGRVRSLIFIGIGAAALAYGAHEYSTRYSDSRIWERQGTQIEREYRRASRDSPADADSVRSRRYAALRSGLDGLQNASGGERCRFEMDFDRQITQGGPEAATRAISRESYIPYEACRPEHRLQSSSSVFYGLGGILALLAGVIGFIRSFRRPESALGSAMDRARKRTQEERRGELLREGFHRADAYSIAAESVRVQSVDEALSGSGSARAMISALKSYGFTNDDVRSLLIACPPILNRSSLELSARLSSMEEGGAKSPEEVRDEALRLPGLLG